MMIPTNGALMDADQFEKLREQVQTGGSPLERAMLRQMDAMLRGVADWKRSGEQHRKCWMEAENDLLNTRIRVQNTQTILKTALKPAKSKISKDTLLGIIHQALDELPVVEVEAE